LPVPVAAFVVTEPVPLVGLPPLDEVVVAAPCGLEGWGASPEHAARTNKLERQVIGNAAERNVIESSSGRLAFVLIR